MVDFNPQNSKGKLPDMPNGPILNDLAN